MLLNTITHLDEDFNNGVPWYGAYYLASLKDKVNFGFSVNSLNKEEKDLFEGQGKFMRHIKIYQSKDIDEKKLKKLIKLVHKKTDHVTQSDY